MAEHIPAKLLQDAPFSVTVLVNAFQSIELILAFFRKWKRASCGRKFASFPEGPPRAIRLPRGTGPACGDFYLFIAKLQDRVETPPCVPSTQADNTVEKEEVT